MSREPIGCARRGIEVVLIEAACEGFSSIEIDDEAGGRLAAEYLLAQGHLRLGFVGDANLPEYAIPNSDWRLAGYRAAMAQAGLSLSDAYVGLAPHGLETARRQAHRMLNLPEPPTAVFAHSDTQAIGVLKAAR